MLVSPCWTHGNAGAHKAQRVQIFRTFSKDHKVNSGTSSMNKTNRWSDGDCAGLSGPGRANGPYFVSSEERLGMSSVVR